MPDEEKPGVAVAEPTGADSEQEPKAEEVELKPDEQAEGGAAAEQEEGPVDLDAEVLAKLKESPELANKLFKLGYEALPDETKAAIRPEAATEQSQLELRQASRESEVTGLIRAQQEQTTALNTEFDAALEAIGADPTYDGEGKAIPPDLSTVKSDLVMAAWKGERTRNNLVSDAIALNIRLGFEESGIKLSKEARAELDELGKKPRRLENGNADMPGWIASTIAVWAKAAKESAPTDAVEKKLAKEREELGHAKEAAAILDSLSGTRKRPVAAGTAASNGVPTPQEYNDATPEKRREWKEQGINPAVPSEAQA